MSQTGGFLLLKKAIDPDITFSLSSLECLISNLPNTHTQTQRHCIECTVKTLLSSLAYRQSSVGGKITSCTHTSEEVATVNCYTFLKTICNNGRSVLTLTDTGQTLRVKLKAVVLILATTEILYFSVSLPALPLCLMCHHFWRRESGG